MEVETMNISTYEDYLEIPAFLRQTRLVCDTCGEECNCTINGLCDDCIDYCLRSGWDIDEYRQAEKLRSFGQEGL